MRRALFATLLFPAFIALLTAAPGAFRSAEAATVANAANEFVVPELTGPVVDQAGVISAGASAALENGLRALKSQTGTQITILTVSSLKGLPIEQVSIQVVDRWKLGEHKVDKGVLLLIAPTEHRLRIEVGRGLEGVLTDADSKRIIDQSMVPLIRSGDFGSAALVGAFQIAQKTDPDFDLRPYFEMHGRTQHRPAEQVSPFRIVKLVLGLLLLLLFLGGRGGWLFLLGGMGGFGGGGRGGGGGGGWGGGGGGFSGGGASGDW